MRNPHNKTPIQGVILKLIKSSAVPVFICWWLVGQVERAIRARRRRSHAGARRSLCGFKWPPTAALSWKVEGNKLFLRTPFVTISAQPARQRRRHTNSCGNKYPLLQIRIPTRHLFGAMWFTPVLDPDNNLRGEFKKGNDRRPIIAPGYELQPNQRLRPNYLLLYT